MPQKPNSRPNSNHKTDKGAASKPKGRNNRPRPQTRTTRKPNSEEFKPANSVAATPPPVEKKIVPIDPDYVIIAQISTPFGLRGGVKAEVRTDFPERFDRLEQVYLAPPGAFPGSPRQLYKVMNARLQNAKQVVFRFEGVSKVEQAELLRGYTISVPRGEVIPLPEGEYYIFQLIGLEVYSDTDVYVGQVVNVLQYPANDVYEVKGPLSAKPILIPAIKQVVLDIDLEQQRLTINLMDGLID